MAPHSGQMRLGRHSSGGPGRPSGLLFRHKILLLILATVLLMTGGLGWAAWRTLHEARQRMAAQGGRILADQTEAAIQKLLAAQASALDVQLNGALATVERVAGFVRAMLDHHTLGQLKEDGLPAMMFNRMPHVVAAWFATPEDILLTRPNQPARIIPEGLYFLIDPAFPSPGRFQNGRNAAWSAVRESPFTDGFELVVDAVAPVWLDDVIGGYVGVSLSLTRLVAQFNQHQPLRGGYTFVLDARRQFLGGPPHARLELSERPDYSPRMTMDLSRVADPALDAVLARMAIGGSGIEAVTLKGSEKYIAYHPLRAIDWRLGLAVPVKIATAAAIELMAMMESGIHQALYRMLFWAGILLALALLAALTLARQMSAPVAALSRASVEIAAGDFTRRVPENRHDELGALSRAFNQMTARVAAMVRDLAASEARFRSLSESSPDIIFMLDLDFLYTYVNPAFGRLLGHERGGAEGLAFTRFVPAETERNACRDAFRRVAGARETVRDLNLTLADQQGRPRQFTLSCGPNMDAAGAVVSIVGICKDISEQRQLEARLQQAVKMEAVGTLAGGMAHDFNNLLTGILGNASLLLLHKTPDHPDCAKLKRIEQYVNSGAELTRQLLGFARGGKYEVKPTDLNKLLGKTAGLFGRTRKEIRIHFDPLPELEAVEVDRGQIEQVLFNIFINAWHAMPEGGDLFLRTERVTLCADYARSQSIEPGRHVRVSCTDTGIGMDKATQARIFEPFFTTKQMGRGTGLGLASAYGIIRNHGGTISVYSEQGKGSTFNIYLPLSGGRAAEEEVPPARPLEKGAGVILLVDDETGVMEVGREMLAALGYQVLAARSGERALELFRVYPGRIDLVILDMIMPGIGGGQVFDRLRESDPNVRVLLSSGYSLNGQAAAILKRGCDGFIQKPFTLQGLSDKIREVMEKDRRAG